MKTNKNIEKISTGTIKINGKKVVWKQIEEVQLNIGGKLWVRKSEVQKAVEDAYIAGLEYAKKKKKLYCKYCGKDYVKEKQIGCYCGIPQKKRSKYHRWVYEDEHSYFETYLQTLKDKDD